MPELKNMIHKSFRDRKIQVLPGLYLCATSIQIKTLPHEIKQD